MITLFSAIRRRPGLGRAGFFRYLRDVHGEIALANTLQLSGYRQNHISDVAAGTRDDDRYAVPPDRDAVIELLFAGLPELFATMSAPYTRDVVGPDGVNFSDLPTAAALLADVVDLSLPRPGASTAKAMIFVRAVEGISLGEFSGRWDAAILGLNGEVLERVRGGSVHHRLAEGDELVRYFGGQDAPQYQGVLTLRLADTETALRDATAYLAAIGAADTGYLDRSRSFVAIAEEITIFPRP